MDFKSDDLKLERPKIGREVSPKIMKFLIQQMQNYEQLLKQSERDLLDQRLVENFRFFSIIDKNVRTAIYRSCELVHYEHCGTLVESDVEKNDYVYVVL